MDVNTQQIGVPVMCICGLWIFIKSWQATLYPRTIIAAVKTFIYVKILLFIIIAIVFIIAIVIIIIIIIIIVNTIVFNRKAKESGHGK